MMVGNAVLCRRYREYNFALRKVGKIFYNVYSLKKSRLRRDKNSTLQSVNPSIEIPDPQKSEPAGYGNISYD